MERNEGKYVDPKKAFIVHPNVQQAYENYTGDPEEFKRMMRDLKDGHNDEFDDYMRQVAEERTLNALTKEGWKYPQKRKR